MIDMQMLAQIKQLAQKGTQMKDILYMLKTKGVNPQTAEDLLCEAFPELKRAKQAIQSSGMNTNDYLKQLMKQNNIPQNQFDGMMNDLKNLLG